MITDTCVDPIPSLVTYIKDAAIAGIGDNVFGEEFPDGQKPPAIAVTYVSATLEHIRVGMTIRAGNMPEAMGYWTEVDGLVNFWSPRLCGLNNGFVRRVDGTPFQSRDKNTNAAQVTAYYIVEMGG